MIALDRVPRWPLAIALIVALPLATIAAWQGLGALASARAGLGTLSALAAAGSRPAPPLLPAGGAFAERDRDAAAIRFRQRLGMEAGRRRLLVERLEIVPGEPARPALLVAHIALSGREEDIISYVRAIEAGAPAIRFAGWRIGRAGLGESAIRLEGQPIALWAPGR